MKIEDHFKETLNRAVSNEPPVLDAWDRFENRAGRGRRVRLLVAITGGAALVLAAAIVVPKLGTKEVRLPAATQPPPSPSPTPSATADAYADFQPLQDQGQSWILYYPKTWTESVFEGVTSLQPGEVENVNKGLPTFVVDVQLAVDEEVFPAPPGDAGNYVRAQRKDGRAMYRTEETHLVKFRIDWTKPCPDSGSSCVSQPRTLIVAIRGSTEQLWNDYIADARLIVDSIEYSDTAAG